MIRWICLATMLSLLGAAAAWGESLIPFVLPWDDATPGVTDVSGWQAKPAGKAGFVRSRGGHLCVGAERIRFLGVNLCFGADFPSHADAEKIAARMAKFGINCVRFHHMDSSKAPNGILADDLRALDPGQLDKLDYLVAQLKAQGIYADLNLHVSRTYPGMPTWPGMPGYFKGVDNFHPEMIAQQKDYARALLTHENLYTKTRYVDEPAVALIEINNENGLVREWWDGSLDEMPAVYANSLESQWNAWLRARYASPDALKTAWDPGTEPGGGELLPNGDFSRAMTGWTVQTLGDAKAASEVTADKALQIRIEQPDSVDWHAQFYSDPLTLAKGTGYTLTFRAKADSDRKILVNAMQAHDPWRQLWAKTLRITGEWKSYRLHFAASEGDENARIGISNLAQAGARFEFAAISLVPSGRQGLSADQSLGRVKWLTRADFPLRTEHARRDWMQFLYETEQSYWTEMARYLKEDLKARSLVIGSQAGFSPVGIQAKLDVIDTHAYWHHPIFPGKPWDSENWLVTNTPMAGVPDGGTLPGLGLFRVAGKPFIVTEYNHAAPNTYAAEAFPLLAAYAAMQDWDGIFAFAYSHRRDNWDTRRIPNFFDIDQHPLKMATLPAAAAIFRRGDVHSPASRIEVPVAPDALLDKVRQSGTWVSAAAFGIARSQVLQSPVSLQLDGKKAPAPAKATPPGPVVHSDNGELS